MLAILLALGFTQVFSDESALHNYKKMELHPAIIHERPNDAESLYALTSRISAEFALEFFLARTDPRTLGFLNAMHQIIARNAKFLVEIGTARRGSQNCAEDGCSTLVFGSFAQMTQRKLYSIDNNDESIAKAQEATINYSDSVEIIKADPVDYLKNIKECIDFLYLGSTDKTLESHLNKIEAVFDKLHTKSVVAIDGCDGTEDKCQAVKDFLLLQKWKLTYSGKIQVFVSDSS